MNHPIWTPESYFKRFSNLVSKSQFPKFRVWIRNPYGLDSWKKNRRPKILCYCPFNAIFLFPLKQTVVKIYFGWFLKHLDLRKRDYKVGELAGDCRELRNCGSQILKVRSRSSATFFSPQFRNRYSCPQYCGIAGYNSGCPPLVLVLVLVRVCFRFRAPSFPFPFLCPCGENPLGSAPSLQYQLVQKRFTAPSNTRFKFASFAL